MFCGGAEGAGAGREAPRLAARYWEEYSGRQTLLSTFFGKGGGAGGNKEVAASISKGDTGKTKGAVVVDMDRDVPDTPAPTSSDPNTEREQELTQLPSSAPSAPPPPPLLSAPPTSSPAPSPTPQHPQQPPTTNPRAPSLAQYPHEPKKRKQPDESSSSKSKKKKAGQKPKQPAQTKLSTFFVQPSTSSTASSSSPAQTQPSKDEEQEQLEADYKLALELSASQQDLLSQATPAPKQNTNQAQAWSHLLSPLQPPLCLIHKEPTKELTVTKPGPNKGKNFFICSRPVGPGYDRGRGEGGRLREEVNHLFKCGFFKWGSEVRRDALREGAGAGG
jgi:AP endonuclease-2